MTITKQLGLALCGVVLLGAALLYAAGAGWLGRSETAGPIAGPRLPEAVVGDRAARQRSASAALAPSAREPKQILFGDLHVHTTFSFDAFLLGLPMLGGSGQHSPADACDFARYCSSLDFWSINDHAEYLTPDTWAKTVDSVRQCNALAGDAGNPDLVSYLGWEWSQIATTPEKHYGHKNVVLRGLADDEIPTRPIAAVNAGFSGDGSPFPPGAVTALALLNGGRGLDFAHFMANALAVDACPEGVPVRDLPGDCREYAATPESLFAKLSDWDLPAIVIPHGTTWGMYTPPGASWEKQLAGHDPRWQRLVEIYSGHGNAEEYRAWRPALGESHESLRCPAPSDGYLPSCWRAGELVEARCLELGEPARECRRRAAEARRNHVRAYTAGWQTAPGHAPDSWQDAGQCRDCFQPAFNYRPTGSAQYMLAVRESMTDSDRPKRYRFGFIGSSDNHTAKPGTGYKEFWRGEMTEGRGSDPDTTPPAFMIPDHGEPQPRSSPFDVEGSEVSTMSYFENERGTAFFVTGGLVAVHAPRRDRGAIFDALERREVYGTSGPRILLWFDLLDPDGTLRPMGSQLERAAAPHFRVRAAGSFEQAPGCPAHAHTGLAPERLDALCRSECYNPTDTRRPIRRIEIVRVRPQIAAEERLDPLIEDPWLRFECGDDPAGCEIEFDDPEFEAAGRDTVYYARAIEAPSLAIQGSDPLRCERDESGRCVELSPCDLRVPSTDDCLVETEQRAWSSPIYVDFLNTYAR